MSRKNDLTFFASATVLAIALSAPGSVLADGADATDPKAIAGLATPGADLPKAPPSGEMGFVFSDFSYAIYPGMEDACPTGWSNTLREDYLSSVNATERKRLLRPENEVELTNKWVEFARGPNGTNVCTNYNMFPNRPPLSQVKSKISYGLDLDDAGEGNKSNDPYFCPQQTFTSPLGEKGIDNQLYRAMGCTRNLRNADGGPGEIVVAYKDIIQTGEFTMVILLQGVDSLVKDEDVKVILSSSDEQPLRSGQGKMVAGASFSVTITARWRHELKGKIVDGVLLTESKDLTMVRMRNRQGVANIKGRGLNLEWDLERAKLRLAFRPNGSLEGVIGGYELPTDMLVNAIGGGLGTIRNGGIDCAGRYNEMMRLADGGRDPTTGQCTRVSSAYQITAIPAFVFDRPPESSKTAMVTEN